MSDDLDKELVGHQWGGLMAGGRLLVGPSGAGGGGKGGKGGSSSSSGGFTEDPNTMQSDAVVTVVDVLGEGPIAGLYYGLKSVFLNNVPLYNDNGVRNFLGAVADFRSGLPDQDCFVGETVVEQPVLVNQRFTNGSGDGDSTGDVTPNAPVNFEVGQSEGPGVVNPDFIGLTIRITGLSNMDTSKGELKGNTVSFSVWCFGSDMTDFAQIGGDTISGKTTAPYERSYALVPVGKPPWTIQVRRDSIDFTKSTEVGDTYVYGYSLIYDKKLQYINTAAVAFLVDAAQFGSSVPNRSYDCLGRIISVPSNYDPYARTYSGFWDGTFVQKWCNNPAWVVYDLLTNTRYGLGKRIDVSLIDKWALYTIAQYCDERIKGSGDFDGSVDLRFTFDGVIAGQQDAYAVINSVASCFRGMPYWGASGITFSQDAPTGSTKAPDGTYTSLWETNTAIVGPIGSGNVVAMASGTSWSPGTEVSSPSGQFKFRYDLSGNVVLYQEPGDIILWSEDPGPSDTLIMQTDGNLVLYNLGVAVWSTGTGGNDGAFLDLQDCGNLLIFIENESNVSFSSPVAIFAPANVVNGEFNYEGTAEKARHSIALVTYNDPRNDFKQAIEAVEEPALIERYGIRPIRVVAYGCCRRGQAHRYGKWILASEQYETETVTFVCGLEYADLAPGEIIGVADPHKSVNALGGRVITADAGSITTDRKINLNLDGGGYDVMFMNPSGEGVLVRHVSSQVGSPDGTTSVLITSTISGTPDDTPIPGSLWVLMSNFASEEEQIATDGMLRLFRVISNREMKTNQYQITAVEHYPPKYDIVDKSTPIITESGVAISSWPVGSVRNLQAVNNNHVVLGQPVVDVTLSWQAPVSPNPSDPAGSNDPRITAYNVYQEVDNVWSLLTTTTGVSFTISDLTPSTYNFAVRAVTPLASGPYTILKDDVSGDFGTPDPPNGLTAVISYNDGTLSWTASDSAGIIQYNVLRDMERISSTNPDTTNCFIRFLDDKPHEYEVQAVNASTKVSAYATLTFGPLVPPDPTGFAITSISGNNVSFEWDNTPPTGTSYEIRAGSTWSGGTVVATGITARTLTWNYGSDPTGVDFWCRTVSNVGVYSATAISTSVPFVVFQNPTAFVGAVATNKRNTTNAFLAVSGVQSSCGKMVTPVAFLANAAVSSSSKQTQNIVNAVANVSVSSTSTHPVTFVQSSPANVSVVSTSKEAVSISAEADAEIEAFRGITMPAYADISITAIVGEVVNTKASANATVSSTLNHTP